MALYFLYQEMELKVLCCQSLLIVRADAQLAHRGPESVVSVLSETSLVPGGFPPVYPDWRIRLAVDLDALLWVGNQTDSVVACVQMDFVELVV